MSSRMPPAEWVLSWLDRLLLVALLGAAWIAVAIARGQAPPCDRSGCGRIDCGYPVHPAPPSLWSGLEAMGPDPLPANRSSAANDNEFANPPLSAYNWFESLDVENGYLFAGIAHGLQVWDLRSSPANPPLMGQIRYMAWPVWSADPHTFWPLHDVDAPAGDDTRVAIVGQSGTGVAIIDTRVKTAPRLAYQGYGMDATQVYAATLGGVRYAFVASYQAPSWGGGGLRVFNMDAAVASGPTCAGDNPAACPGVYVGKVGTRGDAHYLDGVDGYVAVSAGTSPGVEVWNVANPAAPVMVLNALAGTRVYGVAMWKGTGATTLPGLPFADSFETGGLTRWGALPVAGASYYLGAITDRFVVGAGVVYELQIYDASCVVAGCPAGLPPPLSVTTVSGGSSEMLLTFSRASGGRPFLYATKNDACNDGYPQREFLFDVSNPAAPAEVGGAAYWNWYYRGSATGFNNVAPLGGKFYGEYFYRAGHSIMDAHRLRVGGGPPPAVTPAPTATSHPTATPVPPPLPTPTPTPRPCDPGCFPFSGGCVCNPSTASNGVWMLQEGTP